MSVTHASPYRSPPQHQHIPPKPVNPAWIHYRRCTLIYNLFLWAAVLFLAGLLVFDPITTLFAVPLLPIPFVIFFQGVKAVSCPECLESIVDGPMVMSHTRSLLGLFPNFCTSCGAEVPDGPTPSSCDCPRCGDAVGAGSSVPVGPAFAHRSG